MISCTQQIALSKHQNINSILTL